MDYRETNGYWDEFYSGTQFERSMLLPSQFAVFSLSEMLENNMATVIDLGCGNGRDSRFFLQNEQAVIAIDGSSSAIEKTEKLCGAFENFSCFVHDITQDFSAKIAHMKNPKAFYCRFFLHTLPDDMIAKFIYNCRNAMQSRDMLFLEYRTEEDKAQTKVTNSHYRNFISEDEIYKIAKDNDFKPYFQAKGLGFAKWKDDNAFVARQIFIKKA